MTNEELQELVDRKGRDNTVEVKGEDLHRLLSLQLPYDLLMMFVKELAEKDFTEEDWRDCQESHTIMLKQVREQVIEGYLSNDVNSAMSGWAFAIDKAQSLRMVQPPSSWEIDAEG